MLFTNNLIKTKIFNFFWLRYKFELKYRNYKKYKHNWAYIIPEIELESILSKLDHFLTQDYFMK